MWETIAQHLFEPSIYFCTSNLMIRRNNIFSLNRNPG